MRSHGNHSLKGEKVTGDRASGVFGATLRRHHYPCNYPNELEWKRSRSCAGPVTHSSGDPLCRGAEKTTRVRSPLTTESVQVTNDP